MSGSGEPCLVASQEKVRELLGGFASLGLNCEFGLVQRAAGIEPLGLYRFAAVGIKGLIAAVNVRFKNIGLRENIEVFTDGSPPEYFIRNKAFNFYHHTWVHPSTQSSEAILVRELSRLPLLTRMLQEDLAAGDKIFVVKQGLVSISFGDAVGLSRAIRSYGPGFLLWVALADEQHRSGTVERLGANLLRARIDRFAPTTDAADLEFASWVLICQQARRMVDEARAAPPSDTTFLGAIPPSPHL